MKSNVFHVRSLEEALNRYAQERVSERANPTFTMDREAYEQVKALFDKSYTIHAKRNDGSTTILRRVILHVTPVDPQKPPNLELT